MDISLPKVLVISRNCFSKGGSNGRTLGNFFVGYPVDKIAQFYTYNEMPDFPGCNNYYRVTDKEAIKSYLTFKPAGRRVERVEMSERVTAEGKKRLKRKPPYIFAKEHIWNSRRWVDNGFYKWIEEFSPDVILFFMGGASSLPNLVVDIHKKYGTPIVLFNTEGYYYQERSYTLETDGYKLINRINKKRFRKSVERLIAESSHIIHSCKQLTDTFSRDFDIESSTIYTSSELIPDNCKTSDEKLQARPKITYAGNLALGRHESIIEIGKALSETGDCKIDVYGNALPEIAEVLRQSAGVDYHGVVSYDGVKSIISQSDILVHAETFDPEAEDGLRYGFSTKIADSLASGKCFFVYAPSTLSCVEYLNENRCAYTCSSKEELSGVLKMLTESEEARNRYVEKAKRVAEENHSCKKNNEKFIEILKQASNKQFEV